MITIENVRKRFGAKEVLRGVNLEVRRGETLVIIGRSGCGKSVLLKNIIGLLTPDQGHIYVEGEDVAGMDTKQLYALRKRFGMLFQNSALFDSMTVEENVSLGLVENSVMDRHAAVTRAGECLEMVGLAGIGTMKPADLSGGMRKRVALARAIAIDPEYIFYDEPTTGLDPIMSDVINELIIHLKERLSATSIVVTHDMTSAYKVADRICMLHLGENLYEGSPAEVQATDHPVVRQFIDGRAEGPIDAKRM